MALEFNGNDQYIDLGNRWSGSDLSSGTMMMWVYFDSVPSGTWQTTFSFQGRCGLWFQNDDDIPKGDFYIWDGSSIHMFPNVSLNQWIFLAQTWDGSTLRAYIDGAEADNVSCGSPIWTTGRKDCIASSGYNAPNACFDGKISDARIYNRALSVAEIKTIYNARGSDNIVNGLKGRWLMNEGTDGAAASGASSVIDISGNGNDGTPVNSPIYRASPMKLIKPKMTF